MHSDITVGRRNHFRLSTLTQYKIVFIEVPFEIKSPTAGFHPFSRDIDWELVGSWLDSRRDQSPRKRGPRFSTVLDIQVCGGQSTIPKVQATKDPTSLQTKG
jgi:hypothetical protein